MNAIRTKLVEKQARLTKSGCLYALQCVVSKRSRKIMMIGAVRSASLIAGGVRQIAQRRSQQKQIKAKLS